MNTISSSVQHLAMEGQSLYTSAYKVSSKESTSSVNSKNSVIQTASEVAQNIEQTTAETKQSVQELQKMTETVTGRKLQFSVNKELDSVVVTIVDSETDQVIKEIPSEDMQKLKIRLRKTLGAFYDNLV